MEAVARNTAPDLFGYVPPPKRKVGYKPPVDIFSVEDDLSSGERLLVASYLSDLAQKTEDMGREKTALKLFLEAERYSRCGTQAITLYCPNDYEKYFVRLFCHSRICERCARMYVKDLRSRVLPVVRQIASQRRRGYVLAQITLTVTSKRYKDSLPDREGIVRLYRESSQLLRRFFGKYAMRKTRTGRWREDRKRYVGAGWLAAVEVGKDNNNLHIHALTYGPIRSVKRLSEAWANITGDSFGVDIRRKTPKQAVDYVLKYIGKPPASDSYCRIAEYSQMIKGSRRLRTGGIFYNHFKAPDRDKKTRLCLYCQARLLFDGILDDYADSGYIDYYHAQRHLDEYLPDSGLPGNFLPRGATPLTLPF